MFISVWQGGNKFILANGNCMVRSLTVYLRTKLKITDENVVLDLADEDGNLQNLPEYHPRRNAFRLLQTKVTYIPIAIERNEDGSLKPFTPLVKRMKKDPDFMRQLLLQYEQRERIRRGPTARTIPVGVSPKAGKGGTNAKKSATVLKKGQAQRGKNTR